MLPMRRLFPALLLALAACGTPSSGEQTNPKAAAPAEEAEQKPLATVYDLYDFADIERYNGQHLTLKGTFNHYKWQHGVLKLESGLEIYLPHFDLFMRGHAWHKYLGQRCTATGILHSYTKDIDGYRGPSLQVDSFYGPGD